MEHHVLLNYQYIPENQFFRPKKKKKAGGENGEGSSALQPNEIEIIFRNHPSLPQDIGSYDNLSHPWTNKSFNLILSF